MDKLCVYHRTSVDMHVSFLNNICKKIAFRLNAVFIRRANVESVCLSTSYKYIISCERVGGKPKTMISGAPH